MPKKKEDIVEMGNAVASVAFSEEVKQTKKVLSEDMNSFWYINDASFRGIEEIHEFSAKLKLVESVDFLLCDAFHYVNRQSELQITRNDVPGLNDMEDFSALAEKLIKFDGHSQLFRSALQFSS